VNVEINEQSKQWMHIHSPNKLKKFIQTLTAYQKFDNNCSLGQEMSADGQIVATRDHSNVRSVLRKAKNLCRVIQSKSRGMLTPGVVLLHGNARPHTAARTRTLLEHFNWELFDHPP
jgi:hypothetical protein